MQISGLFFRKQNFSPNTDIYSRDAIKRKSSQFPTEKKSNQINKLLLKLIETSNEKCRTQNKFQRTQNRFEFHNFTKKKKKTSSLRNSRILVFHLNKHKQEIVLQQ